MMTVVLMWGGRGLADEIDGGERISGE